MQAITIALAAGMFLAGIGVGFGVWGTAPTGDGPQNVTITLSGSTTVLPIAQAVAEAYMAERDWLEIQVSGGGSSTGVTQAGQNQTDIGMSSREIKSSEMTTYPNLKQFKIAADGIAIIMNNQTSGGITGLTIAQLRGIYNGTYTNWNQVGGSVSQAITVVGRDAASGTRASFDEIVLGGGTPTVDMLQEASNGLVRTKVIDTVGAIGYVGLGYASPSLASILSINSVLPSTATILDGTYPVARSLYFVTGGPATGHVADFINYMMSPAGQAVVTAEKFVAIETWAP